MLVDKRIVDGLLDLLQMEFCNYNPYHDKEGKFCSKDKANFFAKWNNAPTIELQPNEWDKIQDTKELRKVAKSYLLDVTRYLKLEKEGLGTIRFSQKSIKEYISYSADKDKLLAIKQLPELIEKGKLGKYEKSVKNRTITNNDNIVGFYPIYFNLKTNTGTKKAEIFIAKDEFGNLFFDMFLDYDRIKAQKMREILPGT